MPNPPDATPRRDAASAETTPPASSIPPTQPGALPELTSAYLPPELPPEFARHPTYELVRELGRGGMGVVYLARQKDLGRLEVLKVVQPRLAGRDDLSARFLHEVQLAARVQHPNIVTVHGTFRAGAALVLVMEYIDGLTLAEIVKRKGPLPVHHACYYARQVALGLGRAHEHKMVHRDIKPQNLMVTRRGEVKVLDFGLAKVVSEEGDSGLTGTGMSMGTPEYMPPEQALDARSADIRADIYSLGCTLYFLLTARPPFGGRSPFEVMEAHQRQPPPDVGAARAGLPAGLAALVARMMAKRPGDRPATPDDVARELVPYCKPPGQGAGRKPVSTMPPPPPPRLRRPDTLPVPPPRPRRERGLLGPALAGGAAVVMLALVAGLWAGGVFSPSKPGGPEGPEQPLASGRPAGGAEPPRLAELPPQVVNSLGMKLMRIPAGKFLMGSAEGEGKEEERPRHEVEITRPFYLGAFEVTQAQFKDVMGFNPSYFSADGRKAPGEAFDYVDEPAGGAAEVNLLDTSRFPVENVNYYEALEFCRRLSARPEEKKAGRRYTLPSEAQWEYACRAGATTLFACGDALSDDDANFGRRLGRTEEVGKYPANAWGLHDMHGNVFEHCLDWHDFNHYAQRAGLVRDPTGPAAGTERIGRGGAWDRPADTARAALRGRGAPDNRQNSLGFRVVMIFAGKAD